MKRILLLLLTFLTTVISQGQNIFKDDFYTYSINQKLSEHENKFTDISAGS